MNVFVVRTKGSGYIMSRKSREFRQKSNVMTKMTVGLSDLLMPGKRYKKKEPILANQIP